MATVIEHRDTTRGDNGTGFMLGVLMLIIFAVLFFVYGLPMISNTMRGPQINVPGKIDVNVQNPK
jgi:hypothetical protein